MKKYIELEAVLDNLTKSYLAEELSDLIHAEDAVNAVPVADVVEVQHGEWLNMGDFEQCSVCSGAHLKEFQSFYGKVMWVKTPFCPNCGAKMDERMI